MGPAAKPYRACGLTELHGKIFVETIGPGIVKNANYLIAKHLAIVESESRVSLTEIQKNEYK